MKSSGLRKVALSTVIGAAISLLATSAVAQPPGGFGPGGRGGGPGGAVSARDSAPVDLTGTWVSLVTEDWIERMSPDSPGSGSGGGFGFGGGGGGPAPETSDDHCAAYGAGGIMRVPGRVQIEWQDDNTLLMQFDAGSQRRLIRFADEPAPLAAQSSLQGNSTARWQGGSTGRGGRGGPQAGFGAPTDGRAGAADARWGSLEIVTVNLAPGYLLSSRSWYGSGVTLRELIRYHSAFDEEYFTVTAIVEQDGNRSTIQSSTFRKENNDSGFEPGDCVITPR